MKSDYQVLLFYKFIQIADSQKVLEEQKTLCKRLGLTGRIIIASEGINGTVEGTVRNTETYIEAMRTTEYFSDVVFKKSIGTGEAFPKLSVKVRPEIVTTKIDGLQPWKITGKYISAYELHTWYKDGKEFYIVDMRNDFEYASGYFENFIGSGMKNFSELGDLLPRLEHLKEKTIVTVCTGGIRCEKASGFLLQNGFNDVYQLKDGIVTYMEKYPNEHYKGKLYVFDNRLTMGFNTSDPRHEVVGRCDLCGVSCERYVNCAYNVCHRHYICCDSCLDLDTRLPFCNKDCKKEYMSSTINHRNNTKSVFF